MRRLKRFWSWLKWTFYWRPKLRARRHRFATEIKTDPYPKRVEARVANQIIARCNQLLSLRVSLEVLEAGLKIARKKVKAAIQAKRKEGR